MKKRILFGVLVIFCTLFVFFPVFGQNLTLFDENSGDFSLQLDGSTNSRYYVVEYTEDLTGGEWSADRIETGVDGSQTFSNVSAGTSSCFYRVRGLTLSSPGDYDVDGYTDVEELNQGTDPLDPDNASFTLTVMDFNDAYVNGATVMSTNGRTLIYSGGYADEITVVTNGGSGGNDVLRYVLPDDEYRIKSYPFMLRASYGDELPYPSGTYYRVSFDAKASKNNQYLNTIWSYVVYGSRRTTAGASVVDESFEPYQPVLLSTNWQTYEYVMYLHRDDFFEYWYSSSDPRWFFCFEPREEIDFMVDNIRVEKAYPVIPQLPELINGSFERGAYGWSDRAMWTEFGFPEASETNYAHFEVTDETARTGKRCMKVVRQAMTEARTIPQLQGAVDYLSEGRNYVLSFWAKTAGEVGVATWANCDNTWGGYLQNTAITRTNEWQRYAVLMYRYGDRKTSTILGLINGGPQANRAVQLTLSPQVVSWTGTLYVDDIQLDQVSEEVAAAITNALATGADPCGVVGFPEARMPSDMGDAYWLSTDYSALSEQRSFARGYHHLYPTNDFAVPVYIEKNTNVVGVPDQVDLLVTVRDYADETVCSVTQSVSLVGGVFSNTVTVSTFDGAEGMYTYKLELADQQTGGLYDLEAYDRIFVADYTNEFPAACSNRFLGLDECTLTYSRTDWYSGQKYRRRETIDYNIDVNLPLYEGIGSGYVRLWLYGYLPEEIGWLTNAVTGVRAAGLEPLVCIDGYVSAVSNECYRLGNSAANYNSYFDRDAWSNYVQSLAMLCDTSSACYVQHWEILNEPYDYNYRYQSYTNILVTSYCAIKGVDSNAVIHAFTQILGEAELQMIENCASNGALDYVDVIDYHAYYPKESDASYVKRLKRIVRTYDEGNANAFSGMEEYAPVSIPVWQSEFTPDQPLMPAENRLLDEDRARASRLLQKIITARAYAVDHFFLFAPGPQLDMGFAAKPVNHMQSLPMFNLNYAAARVGGLYLTDATLAEVFDVAGVRAYRFDRDSGGEVLALWSTDTSGESTLGSIPSDVSVIRLDGSAMRDAAGKTLVLTDEPVLLIPDSSPYDWSGVVGE